MGDKFDPDKFLQETEGMKPVTKKAAGEASTQDFDPDKFLAETKALETEGQYPSEQLMPTDTGSAYRSIMDPIIGGIGAIGGAIDKYTGAPTRAALEAAFSGRDSATAFFSQLAEPAKTAPTGKEITSRHLGLSDENIVPTPFRDVYGGDVRVSPADIGGAAVDIVADWSNVVPTTAAAKALGKVAGGIGKVAVGAGKAAEKAVTGKTLVSSTLEGLGQASYKTARAVASFFNPMQAQDFKESVKLAEKYGIDTSLLNEAVEFGDRSTISRMSRVRNEGLLGQGALEDFDKGQREVADRLGHVVRQIAGGVVLDAKQAGAAIRSGYQEALDRIFSNADATYRQIATANPKLKLPEDQVKKLHGVLQEVEKFASKRAQLGISWQKGQAKELADAAQAVRSTGPRRFAIVETPSGPVKKELPRLPQSFSDVITVMQNVGEVAYDKTGRIALTPPDTKRMRELYGQLREVVIASIETSVNGGEEIARNLRIKNEQITRFLKDTEVISRQLDSKYLSDEGLFSAIVSSGNSSTIQSLKLSLPEERFREVKGAFLAEMLRKSSNEESLSFRRALNLSRNKSHQIGALLDPEEIEDVSSLLRLGDRFGPPIMSSSSTGGSNAIREVASQLPNAIVSDALSECLKRKGRANSAAPPPTLGREILSPSYEKLFKQFGRQVENLDTEENRKTRAIERRMKGE